MMIGMIYKDLCVLKKTLSSLILFCAVYVVLGIAVEGMEFLCLFSGILFPVTAMSTLQYDNQWNWGQYCAALPVPRRQYVQSKFLLLFLLGLAGMGAAALSLGTVSLFHLSLSLEAAALSIAVIFFLGLVISGVSLPFSFWLGFLRGKLVSVAVVAIMAGGVGALGGLISIIPGSFADLPVLGILGGTALFTALVLGISYLISVRVYAKKEL